MTMPTRLPELSTTGRRRICSKFIRERASSSDVFGPMGKELVPFDKEADAREFKKDHKGAAILRFKDVTEAVVKGMD